MTNKITFRTNPRSEDIGNIRDIVASTGFFHDYEIPVAVELVEERLKKGESTGYFFVFAMDGEKTIAYACYGEIPCTSGSYDLYWIATHNDYRGKGIGRLLLAETEKEILKRGGRGIYVETSSQSKYLPTQKFYENNQYILEARIRDFYEPGDDKMLYVKRL